jgi:hypothetical protein
LIDAKTDSIVEVLDGNFRRFDFQFDLRSSQLNIQATFSKDTPVKSVRVTLERTRRSFCERKRYILSLVIPMAIFSVQPFPWDHTWSRQHPTLDRDAQVIPLQQEFKVTGCDPIYQVYDVSLKQYGFYIAADDSFSSLHCKVNIFADTSCVFGEEAAALVLGNRITYKIVHQRTERSAPYFLFGSRNDNVFAGSIAAGNYSITASIDGIQHAPLNFTVGNEACTV